MCSRVTRQDFIRANRTEIDRYIRGRVPTIGRLTDSDRAQWIAADESLYTWARQEVGRPIIRPRDRVYT